MWTRWGVKQASPLTLTPSYQPGVLNYTATVSYADAFASLVATFTSGCDFYVNSVLQQTYTPMYFEQTWTGSDIRAILNCLEHLSDVEDI